MNIPEQYFEDFIVLKVKGDGIMDANYSEMQSPSWQYVSNSGIISWQKMAQKMLDLSIFGYIYILRYFDLGSSQILVYDLKHI